MQKTETKYHLGGYYLVNLKSKSYGTDAGKLLYTCSDCINDHIIDSWSYSWVSNKNKSTDDIKRKYQLTDIQIDEIRIWVDRKHEENKLGWINVFVDLDTAIEYKNKFFAHLKEVKIIALYFDAIEKADLIEHFKPQGEGMGEIGLRLTLLKELEEQDDETFIGFDYIGIEIYGGFHTFHCYDNGKEFSSKFGLSLNKFGLFDSSLNSGKILDYLNDTENNREYVPWFIVKTKIVAG